MIRSDTSRCALTLLSRVLVCGLLCIVYVHRMEAISMTTNTQQATHQSMAQQGQCAPASITGQQQGRVGASPKLPPGLPVGANSSVARQAATLQLGPLSPPPVSNKVLMVTCFMTNPTVDTCTFLFLYLYMHAFINLFACSFLCFSILPAFLCSKGTFPLFSLLALYIGQVSSADAQR